MTDTEKGRETLPAQVGDKEHEAQEREKGKQVGLEILALGKVVECAIALGPGNDNQQKSHEEQEDTAQQEERSG